MNSAHLALIQMYFVVKFLHIHVFLEIDLVT